VQGKSCLYQHVLFLELQSACALWCESQAVHGHDATAGQLCACANVDIASTASTACA